MMSSHSRQRSRRWSAAGYGLVNSEANFCSKTGSLWTEIDVRVETDDFENKIGEVGHQSLPQVRLNSWWLIVSGKVGALECSVLLLEQNLTDLPSRCSGLKFFYPKPTLTPST